MGRPKPDLERSTFYPEIKTATIAVATSATDSAAVDLDGMHLFAIETPATLTGTSLTFKVSADNSTFTGLYDDTGTQYSVTVAASRVIYLDPSKFAAFQYLKLISGSTEAADRTFTLYTRAV